MIYINRDYCIELQTDKYIFSFAQIAKLRILIQEDKLCVDAQGLRMLVQKFLRG